MVILKITIGFFFCLALSGCFVGHLLNYPFRMKETITSFPIDINSREPQIFILDNIKTDKMFYLRRINRQGPYNVDICTEDTSYSTNHHVKLSITLIADGIEPLTKTQKSLSYTNRACIFKGWLVESFVLPKNFDRNQKVTLIFQILEDPDGFLKTKSNPKIVVSAGIGHFK